MNGVHNRKLCITRQSRFAFILLIHIVNLHFSGEEKELQINLTKTY